MNKSVKSLAILRASFSRVIERKFEYILPSTSESFFHKSIDGNDSFKSLRFIFPTMPSLQKSEVFNEVNCRIISPICFSEILGYRNESNDNNLLCGNDL